MSTQPDNAAVAASANESDAEESEAAEHSVKDTKALTKEIRDACEGTEIGEDVWTDIEVNEPDNNLSSVAFTIEGDDGLYYEVRVTPKVD